MRCARSQRNVLISGSALRDNSLLNLRPIKEMHKQVCGCITCTMIGECMTVLCQFCLKLLRDLTRKDKERGGCYKAVNFPKGIANNQRASDTSEKKFHVQRLMAVFIRTGIVFWEAVLHVKNILFNRKKEPQKIKHHKFTFLII